ncbi:MAG TPA: hypothetical protein VJ864_08245, partial [Candidatus Binatia bacterium]|nr:hypothetical protein [Candidatus Binatia bacterium]
MRHLYLRSVLLGLFLTWIANFPAALSAAEVSPADQFAAQGLKAFQQGDFEQAALSFAEAARLYDSEGKPGRQSDALIRLSQAYQSIGQYKDALKNLEAAL